jgi:hypothetical protein
MKEAVWRDPSSADKESGFPALRRPYVDFIDKGKAFYKSCLGFLALKRRVGYAEPFSMKLGFD